MNEAEPTTRLRLHVSTAVQGELFPATGTQPVTRGYKGTVASKVAGITYRQLDYWARRQIVEPSITPSHGSGSRRLYSFKDVVILAVSKRLLDAGINLQKVSKWWRCCKAVGRYSAYRWDLYGSRSERLLPTRNTSI